METKLLKANDETAAESYRESPSVFPAGKSNHSITPVPAVFFPVP